MPPGGVRPTPGGRLMSTPETIHFTRRCLKRALPIAALLLATATVAGSPPQNAAEDETALRNKAFQLWQQGNQIAALPLLEKLAVLRPNDVIVLERLGGALVASTAQVSDP